MLESLAFGAPTVLALLLVDRGCRRASGQMLPRPAAGPAAGIVDAAFAFAVFVIAGGVVGGCVAGESIAADVQWIAVFGLAGLGIFEGAVWLGGRTLAGGALRREAGAGNLAAALATATHAIAIAILAGNLFDGSSVADLAVAVGFFALALASQHALVWCFRRLTTYDDAAEIAEHNLGAALSHGGLEIGMALLVAHAADGPFHDLSESLAAYAIALGQGLLFWPLRQVLVECVLLGNRPVIRGGALDRAIGERADVGAGAIEAATYIATALLVRSLG